MFQLHYPRRLDLGASPRLGGRLIELVPGLLPGAHGAFGAFKGHRCGLVCGPRLSSARLDLRQRLRKLLDASTVLFDAAQNVVLPLDRAGRVFLELTPTLLARAQVLFEASDPCSDLVETLLNPVRHVRAVGKTCALRLDPGDKTRPFRDRGLAFQFQRFNRSGSRLQLQGLSSPAQSKKLGLQTLLFRLVFAIPLGGLGLPLQTCKLALELLAKIAEPLEILLGVPDAILGLAAALLVARNARRFLQIVPELLRFCLDEIGDHPLLDDRVASRAESRAEKDVLDVATSASRSIDEVQGLAVARYLAPDRDLRDLGVLTRQAAEGVVEHEFDGC